MRKRNSHISLILIVWLILSKPCEPLSAQTTVDWFNPKKYYPMSETVVTSKDIKIGDYFQYIDSIVKKYNTITSYNLTEHLIVRSNAWIIDSLKNTDYYKMKSRNIFVYDQKKQIALPKGSLIVIPDSTTVRSINHSIQNTWIDINIPEFKLRIFEDSIMLYEFPVRVGRNEKKYLKMVDRIVDLKTKTGTGTIVSHIRNPRFVNPVDNHEYFVTKRDDNQITKLPKIPFLETEIDGIRYGQLIHPTTNPETLGKPYSNGCIGTKESDAWVIYYYAPIGTEIRIRYDLVVPNGNGGTKILEDIYELGGRSFN